MKEYELKVLNTSKEATITVGKPTTLSFEVITNKTDDFISIAEDFMLEIKMFLDDDGMKSEATLADIEIESDNWKIDECTKNAIYIQCIKSFNFDKKNSIKFDLTNVNVTSTKKESNINCKFEPDIVGTVGSTLKISTESSTELKNILNVEIAPIGKTIYRSTNASKIPNTITILITTNNKTSLYRKNNITPYIEVKLPHGNEATDLIKDINLRDIKANVFSTGWTSKSAGDGIWRLTPTTPDDNEEILNEKQSIEFTLQDVFCKIKEGTHAIIKLKFKGFFTEESKIELACYESQYIIFKTDYDSKTNGVTMFNIGDNFTFDLRSDDSIIINEIKWTVNHADHVILRLGDRPGKQYKCEAGEGKYDKKRNVVFKKITPLLNKDNNIIIIRLTAYDSKNKKLTLFGKEDIKIQK